MSRAQSLCSALAVLERLISAEPTVRAMYGYGALNGRSRRPGMVASFPRFKPWKYSGISLGAEVHEAVKSQKRNLCSRSGQRGFWSMKSRKEARARGHAARNPLKYIIPGQMHALKRAGFAFLRGSKTSSTGEKAIVNVHILYIW